MSISANIFAFASTVASVMIISSVASSSNDIKLIEFDTPQDNIPKEMSGLIEIKVRKNYNEIEKAKKAAMFYTEFDYNSIPKISYKAEEQPSQAPNILI